MSDKNEDPEFISSLAESLTKYGWYAIIFLIGVYVLWTKYLKEALNKWTEGGEQSGTLSKSLFSLWFLFSRNKRFLLSSHSFSSSIAFNFRLRK